MNRAVVFLLIAAAPAVVAQDAQIDKEKERLLGSYLVAAYEDNGSKSPQEANRNYTVEFSRGRMIVQIGMRSTNADYTIDPTKKPKAIDLTPLDGVNRGKKLPGIYAWEGDLLKLAWSDRGVRPTDFVSKEDSGVVLFVLKKQKPG
jgi:uncharacterized protein (TIGR03067 family)